MRLFFGGSSRRTGRLRAGNAAPLTSLHTLNSGATMRKFLFTLAFMTVTAAAHAQAPALKADVDVAKGGTLNDGEAILIPSVLLHIPVDGSLFVVKQGGGGTAQAKAKYVVEGFTKEMLQNIAQKAQEDLVTRFRAA